ncbi:MAG: hypothetical protein ACJAYG_001418 [Oceanicoccus sp.]|jgi:hypothetical protein
MWLKVVIVTLFIALVISLFTGFTFLFKDRGTNSRRTWNALSVRLILTGLLISFLFYGVFTGQLGSNAPWDARYQDKLSAPESTSKAAKP